MVQTNRFEIDRLEQYSGRDNVNIVWVPEKENENCTELVRELGMTMEVVI